MNTESKISAIGTEYCLACPLRIEPVSRTGQCPLDTFICGLPEMGTLENIKDRIRMAKDVRIGDVAEQSIAESADPSLNGTIEVICSNQVSYRRNITWRLGSTLIILEKPSL